MRIKIKGEPYYTKNKSVRYAAQFFAKQLLSNCLNHKIKLTLTFTKDICNRELDKDTIAGCMMTWPEEYGHPKEFDIFIKPHLSRADIYICLAHEMKHLEQYARGRLYNYDGEQKIRWKRRKYKSILGTADTHSSLPWEIEADKAADKLIDKLYNHEKELQQQ